MADQARPSTPTGSVTLRFLAAPTDVAFLGQSAVAGGRVLEWVDRAAYACAVGWCSGYCVTAYVGNISFHRPINSGDLVEVTARLILTGRSSMHIHVDVRAASLSDGVFARTTSCTVIFVAVDPDGRSRAVPPWEPANESQEAEAARARSHIEIRRAIEEAMAAQEYSECSDAPVTVFRFLAAPTDVNWGGKTHGGTLMRWIDEAAWACAVGWSGTECLPVFSGGVRFYRPIAIGSIVQLEARLLHTGHSSMHIAVHASCADPQEGTFQLATHCLTVFVALHEGRPVRTRSFQPITEQDRRLEAHAQHLMTLRAGAAQ